MTSRRPRPSHVHWRRKRQRRLEEDARAPAGNHESNGQCERWIRTVEGLVRTYVSASVDNGIDVQAKHALFTWIVCHAAYTYNRFHVRDDGGGYTPYHAIYGREFGSPMLELGEFRVHANSSLTPKVCAKVGEGILDGETERY